MAAETPTCRRYKLDYIGNISKFSILGIRDRKVYVECGTTERAVEHFCGCGSFFIRSTAVTRMWFRMRFNRCIISYTVETYKSLQRKFQKNVTI